MVLPHASTTISVLRAALRLVESSGHIKADSPALTGLRASVSAVVSELEVVAGREPRSQMAPSPGTDFFQQPG